ncbi:hypothetical protein [Streptomyces sp. NPDC007172]|uniref:hypothetical protein n=1 Tax=Streptomyces sp. NPDC007172 TaxID=3364776 RepID=UPI00367B40C2
MPAHAANRVTPVLLMDRVAVAPARDRVTAAFAPARGMAALPSARDRVIAALASTRRRAIAYSTRAINALATPGGAV